MTEQKFLNKIERAFTEYVYNQTIDVPKKAFAKVYSEDDKVYTMVVNIGRDYEAEALIRKMKEWKYED